MRSVDKVASLFRHFVSTSATVCTVTMCAGLLEPHIVLAQGQEEPLPCPSAVPGTPEPKWFLGAVRPFDRPDRGVTNPNLVKSSKPEYPPEAGGRIYRMTGMIWLDARVDTDGRVRNACVARSLLPELDAAAVKAVKEFEFRPAQQNGVPVPAIVRVEFAFNPP